MTIQIFRMVWLFTVLAAALFGGAFGYTIRKNQSLKTETPPRGKMRGFSLIELLKERYASRKRD